MGHFHTVIFLNCKQRLFVHSCVLAKQQPTLLAPLKVMEVRQQSISCSNKYRVNGYIRTLRITSYTNTNTGSNTCMESYLLLTISKLCFLKCFLNVFFLFYQSCQKPIPNWETLPLIFRTKSKSEIDSTIGSSEVPDTNQIWVAGGFKD